MNNPEEKIPRRKKFVALIAKALPPSWRFPVCGLSASVCGLEATEPVRVAGNPDPVLLRSMAEFLGPSELSPLALVQSHVVEVPRGIAWRRGAHLTADGRLIDPLSAGMSLSMDRWLVKRQRFFPKVKRVAGTVVSLSTDGHNNFYHWMLDLLPKLFLVLALGFKDEVFYIGASTRFQKECLKLLGIPPERLLDCNEIPFLQAGRLIVPFLGARHPPNVFNAAKCRLLVETFSSRIDRGNSHSDLPARFVVSRNKTRSRRVVNEDQLLARLELLGFCVVHLEDLSFLDQMTLFARAEAVVASTGAGLIHLVHSRPGTPVAILMPEECPDLVCRDIAAFAKLRCEIFYAGRHPPGTPDKIGCDLVLDEPLLTRLAEFFEA